VHDHSPLLSDKYYRKTKNSAVIDSRIQKTSTSGFRRIGPWVGETKVVELKAGEKAERHAPRFLNLIGIHIGENPEVLGYKQKSRACRLGESGHNCSLLLLHSKPESASLGQ
jgi:hypothetical protein